MLSVFESGYFMRDLDPAGGFQASTEILYESKFRF
jgi:hypothetical protein